MDRKRWLLIAIVVAAVTSAMEGIYHPLVLGREYVATAVLWRPQAVIKGMMPWGWLVSLIASFLLVYIYHRGYEGKGSRLAEGVRFGLIIGIFVSLPMAAWSYITIAMTPPIAIGWFAIGMLDCLVAGVIIALLYKREG